MSEKLHGSTGPTTASDGRLTPEQQAVAEAAFKHVPICVNILCARMKPLAPILRSLDLESIGAVAVVQAARTYDPAKGGTSAYFSAAIRNAVMKAIETEVKKGYHGAKRRHSVADHSDYLAVEDGQGQAAIEALHELTEEDRRFVERHVLDGATVNRLANETGMTWETADRRLSVSLYRLRVSFANNPASGRTKH